MARRARNGQLSSALRLTPSAAKALPDRLARLIRCPTDAGTRISGAPTARGGALGSKPHGHLTPNLAGVNLQPGGGVAAPVRHWSGSAARRRIRREWNEFARASTGRRPLTLCARGARTTLSQWLRLVSSDSGQSADVLGAALRLFNLSSSLRPRLMSSVQASAATTRRKQLRRRVDSMCFRSRTPSYLLLLLGGGPICPGKRSSRITRVATAANDEPRELHARGATDTERETARFSFPVFSWILPRIADTSAAVALRVRATRNARSVRPAFPGSSGAKSRNPSLISPLTLPASSSEAQRISVPLRGRDRRPRVRLPRNLKLIASAGTFS